MRYKVFLNGHNFMIEFDGEVRRLGFYTTRIVDADDEASAEQVAVQTLRQHAGLALRRNAPDNPPSVTIDRVETISVDDELITPGLAFYPEELDD